MTRPWALRVALISLVLFIVLGAGELLFAWAVYEFAGGITDFSYAMHDVEVNERPGPWNNGHPLSKERAAELRMLYLGEYRSRIVGTFVRDYYYARAAARRYFVFLFGTR